MKLNIRTEGLFEKPQFDDGGNELGSQELVYALPLTRFNISNEDELTQALQNLEASASNLRFKKILTITIHYDTYDPTRARCFLYTFSDWKGFKQWWQ